MKDIVIKTIPAEEQRYTTAGDYWETDEAIHFRITKQDSEDYEFLVAVHELVEFYLTKRRGIPEESITKYDLRWEEHKEMGKVTADEPGNEPGCIYATEHRFAENLERQIALEMGINWFAYNDNLKV